VSGSPHESRNLFLEGPAGQLEAVLWKPAGGAWPVRAALVCHPHPLYGGTLHNKVVYQAAKALDALGMAVLRFNFRGAGLSEGVHDRGNGETGDVQAALDFMAVEFPDVPMLVAGFSFGSWVGLRVGCADSRVKELIGLGIPVNSTDFAFLRQCAKPKLFVHGERDEHGDVRRARELVQSLEDATFAEVKGVDHFFTGKLEEVGEAIREWFKERARK
jgi:uncharacterized protein